MSGASLFTWLQDADFYRGMHQAAVELLPRGEQRTWLDVGCGPGLLARLAADRGYRAYGIDRGADMIAAAQKIGRARGSAANFAISDLEQKALSGRTYDVVSASSLLVVLQDRVAGLTQLETLVKPGGSLLIIEATSAMSRSRAFRMALTGNLGKRSYMLLPWAMARSGRALPEAILATRPTHRMRSPLLDGMAAAHILASPT